MIDTLLFYLFSLFFIPVVVVVSLMPRGPRRRAAVERELSDLMLFTVTPPQLLSVPPTAVPGVFPPQH